MVFLNPWVFFAFLPLYFFYKKQMQSEHTRQTKFLYLSLAFMLLALSQPAMQNAPTKEKINSQEYIIALDASYSMQADDLKPSRYLLAREAIKKLLLKHPKDRFTLFAFTSNALLISPPTTDKAISIQALDALNPKYILTKSTNLSHLFKTISKISSKKKNLIIFSDGGDEHDVNSLVTLLKKNNIIPYFVATASQKGAALKKDGKFLKNAQSALVISKINPIIKDMISLSNGHYYEFTNLSVINSLSNDLQAEAIKKPLAIEVQNYKELYFIPLIFAFILFFMAVTKLHQLYVIMPLLILPYKANAGLLDFHYLQKANSSFKEAKYKEAALFYQSMQPTVAIYYNIAISYYKAGEYRHSLNYFTLIKTPNAALKANIFYNIANCAVKLKHYDKAKAYYISSLILKEDADTLYNLNLIRNLKTNSAPKTPLLKSDNNHEKKGLKKQKKSSPKKDSNANSSSNQNSQQSSNGAGGNKKKKKVASHINKKNKKQMKYKMGYKAYEMINKGYSNEKEPW